MGEISAHITLENSGDRDHFRRGYGQESHIRRSTIDAIVDTGAVTECYARRDQSGLPASRKEAPPGQEPRRQGFGVDLQGSWAGV